MVRCICFLSLIAAKAKLYGSSRGDRPLQTCEALYSNASKLQFMNVSKMLKLGCRSTSKTLKL